MLRFLIVVSLVLATACGNSKPAEPTKPADAPLAVAVVMSGHEIWVGNDSWVPADSNERYAGALASVKAGLDVGKLPAGSLGALIVFGDKARVKVAMGPVAQLDAKALGEQKDYAKATGSEMVAGIELGIEELAKAKAGRKVMIVLGDGQDTNHDTAKKRLAALRDRAKTEKVEVHAVVWKTAVSDAETPLTELVPDAAVAKSVDDVKAQLAAKLDKLR